MVRLTTSLKPPARLRRAALRVLSTELGRPHAARLVAGADALHPSIAAQTPHTRAGARDLLRSGAYAIALKRTLAQQGMEIPQIRRIIGNAVLASIIRPRAALYRIGGLRFRRPIDRARWGARVARRLYYTPPDWIIDDVDVEEGFGFDITRCVVAEFFQSLGETDLCDEVICAQDVRTAAHHGVILERSETLTTGGRRCDFRYKASPSGEPGGGHGR